MGKVPAERAKNSKKAAPTPRRRRPESFSFPFAVRSDGRMMINVADCGPYSMEGREIFKGALPTEKEARSVLNNVGDGLAFTASSILRKFPYRRKTTAARPTAKRKAPSTKAKRVAALNTDTQKS